MTKIISIVSQKGGVGKSTASVLLANVFHFQFNLKVAIIDADFPQNSIGKRRTGELRLVNRNPKIKAVYDKLYTKQGKTPYPVIQSSLLACLDEIEQLKAGHELDYIFVDVTGTVNQKGLVPFLHRVNYFFIPIMQDSFSVKSSMELWQVVDRKIKPISKNYQDCFLFFNLVPHKNKIKAIRQTLESTSVKFLDINVSHHAIYERVYRSTLFPIPIHRKEGMKLMEFARCFKTTIDQPIAITH